MKRFLHNSDDTTKFLFTVVCALIIILLSGFLVTKIVYGISNLRTSDGYQAVFLDNGQVYFGKLSHRFSREMSLSDVYYLQFKDETSDFNQQVDSQNPDLTLIKLGSELHGPTDEMRIMRDHILFTEELSADSKVVVAIRDHKRK